LTDSGRIVLDFPLRGETYAYDFVKPSRDRASDRFYDASVIEYLFRGVPLRRCYGWAAEILAPCDGEIVRAEDGVLERDPVNLRSDMKYMVEITRRFKAGKASYREVAGNYIIMECSDGFFALFAHLLRGSMKFREGQRLARGAPIGQVGHSGNSTAPHLHFQVMDRPEVESARGLPCAFREYEELRGGTWERVFQGMPGPKNRIRKNA
jgi:murein DD-endopeptidase MepM/ murein hydrolase activator NlpD